MGFADRQAFPKRQQKQKKQVIPVFIPMQDDNGKSNFNHMLMKIVLLLLLLIPLLIPLRLVQQQETSAILHDSIACMAVLH